MNDRDEIEQALKRMNELWGPWYEVTYANALWHATCIEDSAQFHAASVQELHVAIWKHYTAGLRLPELAELLPGR